MTESSPPPRVALVVADEPLALEVVVLEDERTPAGMVCMGTRLAGRLVARSVVDPEMVTFLVEHEVFATPAKLVLAAQEAPPGLQCRLFAIVDLSDAAEDDDEGEDDEPWAASVPSSDFDRGYRGEEPDADEEGEGDGAHEAAILLGHIVRFERDRRHPDSIALEAADVLASIVDGKVSEVVDKVLEDLLGSHGA